MYIQKNDKLILAYSETSDGNMSLRRGDPKTALKNRRIFLDSISVSPKQVVSIRPVHRTKILNVKNSDIGTGILKTNTAPDCDGVMTNKKDVFLFMVIGDCLPIIFYDEENSKLALIHAGWVGLDKDIIKKTVDKMLKYGSNPAKIKVYIGPSIGPCCNIHHDLKQIKNNAWRKFVKKNNDLFTVNLWELAKHQLSESRIINKNISNPKICTYHNKEFFSHRQYSNEKLDEDSRFAVIAGMIK